MSLSTVLGSQMTVGGLRSHLNASAEEALELMKKPVLLASEARQQLRKEGCERPVCYPGGKCEFSADLSVH